MRFRAVFTCFPFLDLAVAGAQPAGGGGLWAATYTGIGGDAVTVRAEAVLGAGIVWAVQPPTVVFNNPSNDRITIPLDNPANVLAAGQTIDVTATADGLQETVHIIVRPQLQALGVVADHYAFPSGGGAWYAYDLSLFGVPGNPSLHLQIQTLPNTADAWQHVGWAARVLPAGLAVNLNAVNGSTKGLPLNAAQQVRVTAGIAGLAPDQNRDIDIRAPRDWAALANNLQVALERFMFAGGFAVIREDPVNFNAVYSHRWARGQASRPQAFAAGAAVTLQHVTLNVTNAPAALTAVTVRATAYLTHADGRLTALQAQVNGNIPNGHAGNIDLGNINLGNLPNEVMVNDPLLIFWEVSTGGAWTLIEVSRNTVYVTARAPVGLQVNWYYPNAAGGPINNAVPNNLNNPATGTVYAYDSLLAISCTAAAGRGGGVGTADQVRADIYGAFIPANPNNGLRRLGRSAGAPQLLRYWFNWAAPYSPAQTLNERNAVAVPREYDLFDEPNGSIACGVFADMLIAMWALHGINDGHKIGVYTNTGLNANIVHPNNTAFMVRNWDYNNHANLDPADFTHTVVAGPGLNPANDEVCEVAGVDGQNNAAPPPSFWNHYIVLDSTNNGFYDPSYGTPAALIAVALNWVNASTAGLVDSYANRAGYVQGNGGMANGIQPNANVVRFADLYAQAWIY
jgi:hypothetical protein